MTRQQSAPLREHVHEVRLEPLRALCARRSLEGLLLSDERGARGPFYERTDELLTTHDPTSARQ